MTGRDVLVSREVRSCCHVSHHTTRAALCEEPRLQAPMVRFRRFPPLLLERKLGRSSPIEVSCRGVVPLNSCEQCLRSQIAVTKALHGAMMAWLASRLHLKHDWGSGYAAGVANFIVSVLQLCRNLIQAPKGLMLCMASTQDDETRVELAVARRGCVKCALVSVPVGTFWSVGPLASHRCRPYLNTATETFEHHHARPCRRQGVSCSPWERK